MVYYESEPEEEQPEEVGDFGRNSLAAIYGRQPKQECKIIEPAASFIPTDDPMRLVKVEIKSILVAGKTMSADNLAKAYYEMYGYSIPYSRFGCLTLEDLLVKMPEVCTCYVDGSGQKTYMAKTDDRHNDLQYLIRRQLSPSPPSKRNNRLPCSNGPTRTSPIKNNESPPSSDYRYRAPWLKDRIASTKAIGQFPCAPVANRLIFNDEGPKCPSRCQAIIQMVQDIGEKSPDEKEIRVHVERLKNYYYQQTGLSIWGKIMKVEEYAEAWADPQYSKYWRIMSEPSSNGSAADARYYMVVANKQEKMPQAKLNVAIDDSNVSIDTKSHSIPANPSSCIMKPSSTISFNPPPGLNISPKQYLPPGLNISQPNNLPPISYNLPPGLNVTPNNSMPPKVSDLADSVFKLPSISNSSFTSTSSSSTENGQGEAEMKVKCLAIANLIRSIGEVSPDKSEARLPIDKLCKFFFDCTGSEIWWNKMATDEYAETWSDESFYIYWRIMVDQCQDEKLYYVVVPTDEAKNYLHLVETTQTESPIQNQDDSLKSQFDAQLEMLSEQLNNTLKEESESPSLSVGSTKRLSPAGIRMVNFTLRSSISENKRRDSLKSSNSLSEMESLKPILSTSTAYAPDTQARSSISSMASMSTLSLSDSIDSKGEEQETKLAKKTSAKQIRFSNKLQYYTISEPSDVENYQFCSSSSDESDSSIIIRESDPPSLENIELQKEPLERETPKDVIVEAGNTLTQVITSKISNSEERCCALHALLSLLYMVENTLTDTNLSNLTSHIESLIREEEDISPM